MKTVLTIAAVSLFVSGTLAASDALAAKQPRKFPHGCREFGYEYKDQLLVLKPAPNDSIAPKTQTTAGAQQNKTPEEIPVQTIYLIHNVSTQSIYVKVKKLPDQPFSPTQENTIGPDHWAALAVNMPVLQFSCAVPSSGEEMDCTNKFELCQYNHAKFAIHNQGTYWVVKNSDSQSGAKFGSIRNGILLKW